MDHFEFIRHKNRHIELVTAVEQKERRVRNLENAAALAPSEELYRALQTARVELKDAQKELQEHDDPAHEAVTIKTPFGGFKPHWPENPRRGSRTLP